MFSNFSSIFSAPQYNTGHIFGTPITYTEPFEENFNESLTSLNNGVYTNTERYVAQSNTTPSALVLGCIDSWLDINDKIISNESLITFLEKLTLLHNNCDDTKVFDKWIPLSIKGDYNYLIIVLIFSKKIIHETKFLLLEQTEFLINSIKSNNPLLISKLLDYIEMVVLSLQPTRSIEKVKPFIKLFKEDKEVIKSITPFAKKIISIVSGLIMQFSHQFSDFGLNIEDCLQLLLHFLEITQSTPQTSHIELQRCIIEKIYEKYIDNKCSPMNNKIEIFQYYKDLMFYCLQSPFVIRFFHKPRSHTKTFSVFGDYSAKNFGYKESSSKYNMILGSIKVIAKEILLKYSRKEIKLTSPCNLFLNYFLDISPNDTETLELFKEEIYSLYSQQMDLTERSLGKLLSRNMNIFKNSIENFHKNLTTMITRHYEITPMPDKNYQGLFSSKLKKDIMDTIVGQLFSDVNDHIPGAPIIVDFITGLFYLGRYYAIEKVFETLKGGVSYKFKVIYDKLLELISFDRLKNFTILLPSIAHLSKFYLPNNLIVYYNDLFSVTHLPHLSYIYSIGKDPSVFQVISDIFIAHERHIIAQVLNKVLKHLKYEISLDNELKMAMLNSFKNILSTLPNIDDTFQELVSNFLHTYVPLFKNDTLILETLYKHVFNWISNGYNKFPNSTIEYLSLTDSLRDIKIHDPKLCIDISFGECLFKPLSNQIHSIISSTNLTKEQLKKGILIILKFETNHILKTLMCMGNNFRLLDILSDLLIQLGRDHRLFFKKMEFDNQFVKKSFTFGMSLFYSDPEISQIQFLNTILKNQPTDMFNSILLDCLNYSSNEMIKLVIKEFLNEIKNNPFLQFNIKEIIEIKFNSKEKLDLSSEILMFKNENLQFLLNKQQQQLIKTSKFSHQIFSDILLKKIIKILFQDPNTPLVWKVKSLSMVSWLFFNKIVNLFSIGISSQRLSSVQCEKQINNSKFNLLKSTSNLYIITNGWSPSQYFLMMENNSISDKHISIALSNNKYPSNLKGIVKSQFKSITIDIDEKYANQSLFSGNNCRNENNEIEVSNKEIIEKFIGTSSYGSNRITVNLKVKSLSIYPIVAHLETLNLKSIKIHLTFNPNSTYAFHPDCADLVHHLTISDTLKTVELGTLHNLQHLTILKSHYDPMVDTKDIPNSLKILDIVGASSISSVIQFLTPLPNNISVQEISISIWLNTIQEYSLENLDSFSQIDKNIQIIESEFNLLFKTLSSFRNLKILRIQTSLNHSNYYNNFNPSIFKNLQFSPFQFDNLNFTFYKQ